MNNNQKATKRALLTSVMALVMCVVMLVGTTFAWFTDTASTGVNKIVSGNLDVDIIGEDSNEHVATLNFTKANAATDAGATEAVLWEPGCRYLTEGFRIANKGNLALKWKAQVNKGTTASNEGNFDLLDVIDFYLVKGDKNGEGTRLDEFTGNLKKDETSGVYYIKGVMQTTAGNDYQGLELSGITITVYATQDTVENDSFNNQYDKDAPIVYPAGVTSASFDAATSVYYYSTYGGASVKTAAGEDISSHPAVVAYVNNSNVVEYAADLRAALMNGATEVFCKKDAVVSTVGSHVNVVRDVTIYANGADFKGGDLSIHAGGGNYVAPANNENTINIYNAKNLTVWGEPQAVGRVWNVNFYDCANDGSNFFMYRGDKDKTDTFHLTMTNCTANGYSDSTVHATADGSIVIKNCTFTNNCAPVNIAHKQSGTLTVTVEDSKFVNCGKVNPANDYFAPARFVNNSNVGTLNVTLKNNTFTDTIGANGDILLGDYRATGKSFAFTTNITTDHPVMVKSSVDAASSYSGGTINVANH